MPLGYFSLLQMKINFINNLAIWSHWIGRRKESHYRNGRKEKTLNTFFSREKKLFLTISSLQRSTEPYPYKVHFESTNFDLLNRATGSKMDHPWPLFYLFSSFQTNVTIFTANICEKCPSSIWCCDSNPQSSENESPPITTRPGLL